MGTCMDPLQNDYPSNIFVTYANTPLKNNPDGLYETVGKIPDLPYELSTIKESIKKMVGLRRSKGRNDREKKPNCNCSLRRIRKRILNPGGLTCYECDHQYFVHILTEIASRHEFSTIEGFDFLLSYGGFYSENGHTAIFSFIIEKESINLDIYILPGSEESYEESELGKGPFSNFFERAVALSLLVFLANNDRRKLKKCEYCENFYIQSKLDPRQKYCSKKCGSAVRRYSTEEMTRYMQRRREEEKKQRKSLTEEQIKEEQIQRFLNAGYSQEEAAREWLNVGKEILRAIKEFDSVKRDKPVKRQTSRFT